MHRCTCISARPRRKGPAKGQLPLLTRSVDLGTVSRPPPLLPATGPQPGRLCMPHRAGLTFLTSGRSAALSAVSRGDFCHRPKTRPFERLSCQEPAVGNSPAERRLWRSPTSRRDPTARPVRTSSGSPRSLVPQATLRLYGVAHGSRRAAAARARSPRAPGRPLSQPNTKVLRGRRTPCAGRGGLLCVSTAGTGSVITRCAHSKRSTPSAGHRRKPAGTASAGDGE